MTCFGFRLPTVEADAEPLHNGAWNVATGFAATLSPQNSRNFYAVYEGDAFGHPERGIIAGMARAHGAAELQVESARNAAQITVHSLAEGYFGAQRTLSPKRALIVALNAVNRWLFGQAIAAAPHTLCPVSLTALLFNQSKIGIAHIGACQIYRYRNKILSPLMREHIRARADAGQLPSRAVGLDLEIAVDYAEESAETGDRYIIAAGLECRNPETVYASLTERLGVAPTDAHDFAKALLAALGHIQGADKAVMVLDVTAAPREATASLENSLSGLKLRPAPKDGDTWDGFKLGRTLYRGRYTMLKAAYDTVENREVALKIPLPTMLQDEVFAAGFMREAWIGSTVRGAGVARYIDLPPGRRSSLYLVMPLYHGETLETRLHHAPAMGLPEGMGIALKLCEAIQDLAAIQIVHRDIKPENIMLLEGNEVRLLDLGLAYLPGIDVADAVKPGGTLRYMAPELLHGTIANARSEVYALGITIYRMFSLGPYPFGQREAVPLARMRPDLPHWLGEALGKAINPDPARRFADAEAFAHALQIGLITGQESPLRARRKFPLTSLQIWQLATLVFAIGFFALLLRGLK
jgi:hypothetical protein